MQFTKNSLFFPGLNFISLKTVDSTNRFAKDLLSNSRPVADGTVILAETQTAGRGQMTGSWLSESGKNLTFSIIVHPSFVLPEQQFLLNKVVALSVFDLLSGIVDGLYIKWPNDIICSEGKLSGILIENILQGAAIKSSVIGIGINLNQIQFPEGSGQATSLKLVTGADYAPDLILNNFMVFFERRYSALCQALTGEKPVGPGLRALVGTDADYLQALYGYQQEKKYEVAGRQIRGKIVGISESGEVLLESDGKTSAFWLKEIKLIPSGSSPF